MFIYFFFFLLHKWGFFSYFISTMLWALHCLLFVSAPKVKARAGVQWRCFNEAEKKPHEKKCPDNDTSECCIQTLLECHSFMRVAVPEARKCYCVEGGF